MGASIVRTRHTDNPVGLPLHNVKKATDDLRCGVARDASIQDSDPILGPTQREEMPQNLQPRLVVISNAITEANDGRAWSKGEPINTGGERWIVQEFGGSSLSTRCECGSDSAIGGGIDPKEWCNSRVVKSRPTLFGWPNWMR